MQLRASGCVHVMAGCVHVMVGCVHVMAGCVGVGVLGCCVVLSLLGGALACSCCGLISGVLVVGVCARAIVVCMRSLGVGMGVV